MTNVDSMTNDIRDAVEKVMTPKNIQIATVDVDTMLDDNDEAYFLKIDIALDSPAHTIHPNERPVLTVLYENKCDLKMYLNTEMVGDDIVLKRRDNLYFGYNQSKIGEQVSRVAEEFLPIIDESLQKDAEWMVPLEMHPYLDTDLHSLYGEYLKDTPFEYQKRVVSTEFDHTRNAVHPMRSKYEISGEKVINNSVWHAIPMCQVIIRLDEFDNSVSNDVYCAHFTGDVDIKIDTNFGSDYMRERNQKGLPRPSVYEVLDDFSAAIKHKYELKRFCDANGMLDGIEIPNEPQL